MKVIIYGAGQTGERIYQELQSFIGVQVVAFADRNPTYWEGELFGLKIINPNEINSREYDKVVVATMAYEGAVENLVQDFSVPKEKIDISYVFESIKNRIIFLEYFSKLVYDRNITGNVAEGGVFDGAFAKKINEFFPDRTLYLFDTFEGFDSRDIGAEIKNKFSKYGVGHLKTSEEKVKQILPHPEKAIIKKGYFPETAAGIDDKFVFVNLDFDLYAPTLAGLDFFYPKMVHGGVILVHDYFTPGYKGVKKAVDEFCENNKIAFMPIADEISIAIVKQN
ncbi:MAG: macrocin-O-methyltransferase [Oscillospiraceae bacterium]|nr:macrocin-O-methyltransferase [Oscillospiraceae bacterium]